MISNIAYAGFLDELKRQAEDTAKEKTNEIFGGSTTMPNKKNANIGESNAEIRQNSKIEEGGKLLTSRKSTKQLPQSKDSLKFEVSPQYKQLLTLLMQINPKSFNENFMYDYRRFFIKGKTKECSNSNSLRPGSHGSRVDEFELRREMKRLRSQLNEMLDEAKNMLPTSRTVVFKTIDKLVKYDFKKQQYQLFYYLPYGKFVINNKESFNSCAFQGSFNNNLAYAIQLFPKNGEKEITKGKIFVPLSASDAESYNKKYRKRVDVEITLKVHNQYDPSELSYLAPGKPLKVIVTAERIRVRAKGTGKVLANYNVSQ